MVRAVRGGRKQPLRSGGPGRRQQQGGKDSSLASLPPGECDTGETRASPPSQKGFLSPPPLTPRYILTPSGRWVSGRLFTNLLISDSDILSDNSVCK